MKLSLFIDDMIIYAENPKKSMETFLELLADYSKFAGDEANVLKSITFPYTNN